MKVLDRLIHDLPEDRNSALIQYAERLENICLESNYSDPQLSDVEIKAVVDLTFKICDLWEYDIGKKFDISNIYSYEAIRAIYTIILSDKVKILEKDITYSVNESLNQYINGTKITISERVTLSTDEKEKIRERLAIIRVIIQNANLSDAKKEALLARIHELEKEVDNDRTKSERFFAFTEHVLVNAVALSEKGKTVAENYADICRIIAGGRARQEKTALPKPDDMPQLSGYLE